MTYGTLGGNLKLNLIACDFIIAQKIIDFREYNLLGLPCIINVSMKDQSFYKSLAYFLLGSSLSSVGSRGDPPSSGTTLTLTIVYVLRRNMIDYYSQISNQINVS